MTHIIRHRVRHQDGLAVSLGFQFADWRSVVEHRGLEYRPESSVEPGSVCWTRRWHTKGAEIRILFFTLPIKLQNMHSTGYTKYTSASTPNRSTIDTLQQANRTHKVGGKPTSNQSALNADMDAACIDMDWIDSPGVAPQKTHGCAE